MSDELMVDAELLRAEVRQQYKEVAVDPHGKFHFHTGRPLASRLGYDVTAATQRSAGAGADED